MEGAQACAWARAALHCYTGLDEFADVRLNAVEGAPQGFDLRYESLHATGKVVELIARLQSWEQQFGEDPRLESLPVWTAR
ncbi:hypothetical protein ACWDUL_20705 [Nocardia niigatensis]